MISWNILLVLACLLLLFLFYKEWTRKSRAYLYLRLLASLLAVASLLLMAAPFMEHKPAGSGKIIILTEGFIKDSIDQFVQANGNAFLYADREQVSDKAIRRQAQLITDWPSFAAEHATDTMHVFGNGLSKSKLIDLYGHPIIFHPVPPLPAVSNIYWKKNLETGEPLIVQGHFENPSAQKIKLVLQAFEETKDSIIINAGDSKDFVLRMVPVHTGHAVYSLKIDADDGHPQQEPIPVAVGNTTALKLLIISSSPDFENTYLKNQLSQQGYAVSFSTSISTHQTNKQFLNTSVQSPGRLTASYLAGFDLLMADETALKKLSVDELNTIRSAILEKGTGLLVKLDAEKSAGLFYSKLFPVKAAREKQSLTLLKETTSDSDSYKLKLTDSLHIITAPGTQSILQDIHSAVYAATALYGNGKITATTLQNTYSMALAGDLAAYRRLWSLLLDKTATKTFTAATWLADQQVPRINQPVLLQAMMNDSAGLTATVNKTRIYLKQQAGLRFLSNGKYWPEIVGWQALPELGGATGDWNVYGPGDWQQLQAYTDKLATEKYAARYNISATKNIKETIAATPVNWSLLLLILLLSSCIFLWVEQKAG